jgi:CheY-like chemotaxis protein
MENKILHVEDNPDDVMLVKLAFKRAGATVDFASANDGDRAIALLKEGLNSAPPICVLLDVKLPTVSGFEVLTWIRAQLPLKKLPVVILTSSLLPDDINRAYDMGANSYLIKPPDLGALVELAKTIDLYWVKTNTRPIHNR